MGKSYKKYPDLRRHEDSHERENHRGSTTEEFVAETGTNIDKGRCMTNRKLASVHGMGNRTIQNTMHPA